MTTQHDHSRYLDQSDDPQAFWAQRISACRWMIARTFALGAFAAGLGVAGQGFLEQAAPLFPFISQNYGLWQASYLLSLLLIFLLWSAAMLQKISLLQNSKQGLKTQQRIDEQNARREERARENRERREQLRKDRDALTITPSFFKNTEARSKKFDY
ncbi:hypothetical protein [Duganella callida]|uniref:Uncharacterized protein n=1 Tax=Duganella callida TaxID=2561932 RepID=A0A4Y9SEN3_9BURK|nr:hypothetical protein [Duganella callida]TFW21546.1 hypothetical protein E4L98_13265 [Duganella callida]